MRGLLISFDGLDSSGKETQVTCFVDHLKKYNVSVQEFATPDYTTATGKKLKALLQDQQGWLATEWSDKMKLFAANRHEHRTEVMAALQRGEVVVYDRYVPSSLAFFAAEAMGDSPTEKKRADVHQYIADHEYGDNNMPKEDISVFLDVTPDISSRLLDKRKQEEHDQDEYTDSLRVQQRLYDHYDWLCTHNPEHYLRIPCLNNGQLESIETIARRIWDGLTKRYPQLHPK